MNRIKQLVVRFAADESGQNLVEYALVVALVALAAITAMGTVGNSINSAFTKIGTSLNSAL